MQIYLQATQNTNIHNIEISTDQKKKTRTNKIRTKKKQSHEAERSRHTS